MAVAHVASATTNTTTGTTTDTITIPASVAAGHDLYVQIISRGGGTPTCTDDDSGGNTWTLLGTDGVPQLHLFWKKATSGTASKTVTIAAAVDSVTGGLSAFSGGLASGDPTTNIVFESNISGNETHATFTPTHADSMICFGVANTTTGGGPVTLMTCTNPGDMEPELWERSSTGGSDCYAILAAKIQVGGPTTTGAFTWAMTNASSKSVTFAIRPEVAAGGGLRNRSLLGVG